MRNARDAVFALIGAAVLGTVLAPPTADAQVRDRLRERVRQQAERRADAAADRVVCVATDRECVQAAHREGREVTLADADGNPLEPDAYPADALAAGEGVWLNYDFVPGERAIFVEDFERDRAGDFPRRLVFIRGNMEVAAWQDAHWLRASTDSRFAIDLPEPLPERFTIEFDYNAGGRGPHSIFFTDDERNRTSVRYYYSRGGVRGGGVQADGRLEDLSRDRVRTVRVMADGSYVKVYLDETRVANVPNADLGRSDRIVFHLSASANNPVMLRDFRIAAGGRTLYDALAADGRVVTRGILFDTGSDRIRPESTPTLEEIAGMLGDHPDLRLRIEGHTDSVGDAAANQALSERRATSVLRYLVARHDIDEARLEAAGLGEDRPIDTNETAEGRQNNRRVELVRS